MNEAGHQNCTTAEKPVCVETQPQCGFRKVLFTQGLVQMGKKSQVRQVVSILDMTKHEKRRVFSVVTLISLKMLVEFVRLLPVHSLNQKKRHGRRNVKIVGLSLCEQIACVDLGSAREM